jgi:hypothetical protein
MMRVQDVGGTATRPSVRGTWARLGVFGLAAACTLSFSCHFDSAYRDVAQDLTNCTEGVTECRATLLTTCKDGQVVVNSDCGAQGLACSPTSLTCTPCSANSTKCDGPDVLRCDAQGQTFQKVETCDGSKGIACRSGGCVQLCQQAQKNHSNVGCEYWGVDLDNAVTSQGNAAAQQYAIVLSNPQPDLYAHVTVEEDDSLPGQPPSVRVVGSATVTPRNLEVFKLGPREVDGSADGTFNTGTGTALTRHAYRVRSDVPIVSYQFNPLENVNVFSNDASQMLPTESLGGNGGRAYVVAGWPQTIAMSDVAAQNFGINLRVFMALVGTRANTHVHIKSQARIIPGPMGGPAPNGVPAGGTLDAVLQPFEVLNLETGDFNADFTGSLIDADGPVAVYVGSEASDAPFFNTLAERSCCADHLEQQLTPLRAVGKTYVLGHVPNRTRAVFAAGGAISIVPEPEYYRVVSASDAKITVTTTLPAPYDTFELDGAGQSATLTSYDNFQLTASGPVIVADVQASQEAAGVQRGLPGGDPSLVYTSPVEQWRSDYVLLTPDKYAFDFVIISARRDVTVYLDSQKVDSTICDVSAGDGLLDKDRGKPSDFVVYRCQLSFPTIDPQKSAPNNVGPGRQNDGVHRVQSDFPVGVLVYGFDSFVSYAYAGGTELSDINVQ